MSTVESPATHTVVTAVNSASTKFVDCPFAAAAGSENKRLNAKIIEANTAMANCDGEVLANASMPSRTGAMTRPNARFNDRDAISTW
jgi:hypothetical protein